MKQNDTVRFSLFADTHQTNINTAVASGSAVLNLTTGDEVDIICMDANLFIEGS